MKYTCFRSVRRGASRARQAHHPRAGGGTRRPTVAWATAYADEFARVLALLADGALQVDDQTSEIASIDGGPYRNGPEPMREAATPLGVIPARSRIASVHAPVSGVGTTKPRRASTASASTSRL
jgi:hypothetical protein